jgi:hypothetical protein
MYKTVTLRTLPLMFLISGTGAALAQTLPTTQPNMITIVREEVKVGRIAEHQKIEAGWPAAFEKAKSPYYYLALVSTTGPTEAWYISAFESNAAIGDSMKREDSDPVLSAELARLQRADADVVSGVRMMQASARKDLSFGTFPDITKERFFEITWFRVRPGHEAQFEAAGKAYGASAKRADANSSYRVYEITAGVPGPTYLVISSVPSYADFDRMTTDGEKTMKGFNPDEGTAMQKFMLEGVLNMETQRFKLDPVQSYVPKEVRSQDTAFWMPKKPAAPKAATGQ